MVYCTGSPVLRPVLCLFCLIRVPPLGWLGAIIIVLFFLAPSRGWLGAIIISECVQSLMCVCVNLCLRRGSIPQRSWCLVTLSLWWTQPVGIAPPPRVGSDVWSAGIAPPSRKPGRPPQTQKKTFRPIATLIHPLLDFHWSIID